MQSILMVLLPLQSFVPVRDPDKRILRPLDLLFPLEGGRVTGNSRIGFQIQRGKDIKMEELKVRTTTICTWHS